MCGLDQGLSRPVCRRGNRSRLPSGVRRSVPSSQPGIWSPGRCRRLAVASLLFHWWWVVIARAEARRYQKYDHPGTATHPSHSPLTRMVAQVFDGFRHSACLRTTLVGWLGRISTFPPFASPLDPPAKVLLTRTFHVPAVDLSQGRRHAAPGAEPEVSAESACCSNARWACACRLQSPALSMPSQVVPRSGVGGSSQARPRPGRRCGQGAQVCESGKLRPARAADGHRGAHDRVVGAVGSGGASLFSTVRIITKSMRI